MLVTYGHNLSDFVSFLLFWRSGCQTLPWCQSRKCCEHYCDPADCSDWRSGKKKSLFCLFLQFFSLISLTLNRPCSINTVIVTVSSFYRVCTLTCSQWITDVREWAAVFYVIAVVDGEREERLFTIWPPLQMKDVLRHFPSGSLDWGFLHALYMCMYVWWEKQSAFPASVFFLQGS